MNTGPFPKSIEGVMEEPLFSAQREGDYQGNCPRRGRAAFALPLCLIIKVGLRGLNVLYHQRLSSRLFTISPRRCEEEVGDRIHKCVCVCCVSVFTFVHGDSLEGTEHSVSSCKSMSKEGQKRSV